MSDEPSTCPKATCEKNEFACRNGHCINSALVCNAVDDCGDNSDEDIDNNECSKSNHEFRVNSHVLLANKRSKMFQSTRRALAITSLNVTIACASTRRSSATGRTTAAISAMKRDAVSNQVPCYLYLGFHWSVLNESGLLRKPFASGFC
jgi:hypothetical protein